MQTYEMYQRGETNGTFQFQSAGMQKYLRELRPDKFDDLIAMNALYRPGPLEYIPNFIKRKHGEEAIVYDLPEMEEYLKDTYGITVYQEQVMLLAQKIAGFSKGDADVLRKALKERHLQDSINAFRHVWRTTLGDYLRGPQQNLRFLLPLVYRNQVMTARLTESILQGKSVVR